ncbi:MAG: PQQ-binding-like beta-propeller repeat protein [Candidatus Bathyarchaeota archaeon]|nr:PQQ-binding-like beta-propeller repeat protein [Candidatus Bathyarchaeota archaeon]
MQFKKTSSILMTAFLILSIAIPLISVQTAAAASSGEMASFAFVAVAPNPVGVGQTTYVSMWVDVPLPDASESNEIRRHDYELVITDPDGNTETETWDVIWDTTGVQSTSFTPDKVGNYTLTFTYPDQTYTWNATTAQQPYYGLKYLGDNATTTLTVQEEAVNPSSNAPLPSEYWSRPIYGANDNWYTIASHWLGGYYFGTFQLSGYNLWQTGGSAPDSSHVLWTYPIESGGVVGGTDTYVDGATYYSGGSYEGRFQNAIILDGKLFYKEPLSDSPTAGAYTAIDLATGKVLWTNDTIYPTFGELYTYESPNQHGTISNGYLWQTVTPTGSTANQTWIAYDPETGKWLFNLTDVPSTGTIAYTENGEIVKYILSYNTTSKTGWLALWNWTSAPTVTLGLPGSGTNALQYRPVGKNINCSTAYSWNVTITADLTGNASPAIAYVLEGDTLLGTSSSITAGVSRTRGTADPYTVWALSLDEDNIGRLLWKKSFSAPSDNTTRTLGPLDPVNRVWTMTDAETMQWLGYSLDNGNLLWGPTDTEMRAMQYFSSGSGAGQRGATAYGNLYVQGFGGELFCYDTSDGSLLWKYNNTSSGADTGWGLMPIFISAVADGKVYAFNNEHSPNSPLYNGYSIYCINATSGEEIYKMLSWSGQTGGTGTSTAVLADGSLVYYNYYDNQLYCIGKGATKTTVSAPSIAATSGQSVVISGTVTDISVGTTQTEQAARFPNGVPVASDASTSAWMEYVYMDQAMPTDFTGVNVEVNVVDSNGNYRAIGTATTDSSGFYHLNWTPDITGSYTVIAIFEGNNGYYGSYSEAAFAVDEAAATPTPQATQPPSAADLYFLPMSIAIIIAVIAIGAVLALLLLRKHP